MKQKPGDTLKSVEKALQILEAFRIQQPELSISELEERLGVPKVSLYRFLRVLTGKGFVMQDPQTRKYRLGIKVFQLGSIVLKNMELRNVAFPLMEELSQKSGETVHLGVIDGSEAVSIEGVESGYSLRTSLVIGNRVGLHCTGIGKALFAFLQDEEIDQIIAQQEFVRFTEHTITDPTLLKREIDLIRSNGYALDNEENEPGIRCVAAPILDASGRPIASISVSGPSIRMTNEKIPALIAMVLDTSRQIARALGYVPA